MLKMRTCHSLVCSLRLTINYHNVIANRQKNAENQSEVEDKTLKIGASPRQHPPAISVIFRFIFRILHSKRRNQGQIRHFL